MRTDLYGNGSSRTESGCIHYSGKVAAYGTEHGYVDEENNTYWRFMDEAGANWNLNSVGGMLSEEQVSAELAQGHPVICSMGPGNLRRSVTLLF